jgi:hypothetical protein
MPVWLDSSAYLNISGNILGNILVKGWVSVRIVSSRKKLMRKIYFIRTPRHLHVVQSHNVHGIVSDFYDVGPLSAEGHVSQPRPMHTHHNSSRVKHSQRLNHNHNYHFINIIILLILLLNMRINQKHKHIHKITT